MNELNVLKMWIAEMAQKIVARLTKRREEQNDLSSLNTVKHSYNYTYYWLTEL